jgi:Outer membrane protein beta-barrel domain
MEENFNHPVDRLFQEAFSYNETEPAGKVWNKIAGELDKADDRLKLRLAKKRFSLMLTFTGILLLLNFALYDYSGLVGKTERPLSMTPVAGPEFISNRTGNPPAKTLTDAKNTDPDQEMKAYSLSVLKSEVETPSLNPGLINFPFPKNEDQMFRPGITTENTGNRSLIKIQTRPGHRLSVEPFFLREFAGYNFSDNDVMGNNGRKIEQRERNMFSASGGFYLNYAFSPRWVLQTGLVYSGSESNIDSSSTYAKRSEDGMIRFKFNTISGYSYLHSPSSMAPAIGDSIRTSGTSSDLRYFSIPLIISYRIPVKRFSALIGVGSTFNILNSAVLETDIYDANLAKHEDDIPLKGLKKINFGMIVKAELSYQVKKQWSVNLMSSFKNTLGPINLNSAISAYPYNIGIGLGLTHQF